MKTHTYSALAAYEQCVAGMLADPELSGDLLLIGVVMARRVHLGRDTDSASARAMARAVFGCADDYTTEASGEVRVTTATAYLWRRAMCEDIRRYDYRHDPAYRGDVTPCGAPTPRKAACGKRASMWCLLTDPGTGRRLPHGWCTKHHEWGQATDTQNRAELEALDIKPVPAANTGGLLRRHLPGFDWEAYWRTINPQWVEPPEASPVVPTPPTLRLIISDDLDGADPTSSPASRKPARRRLTLLQGDGGEPA